MQALSDLCEALISCDALFLHDGGLHCHLEMAFLVGGREGGERVGRNGSGEENGGGWGREGEGSREVGEERKREMRRVKRAIEVRGEDN